MRSDGLAALTAQIKTRRLEGVVRAHAVALALRMSHPDYHRGIVSDDTLFCNALNFTPLKGHAVNRRGSVVRYQHTV